MSDQHRRLARPVSWLLLGLTLLALAGLAYGLAMAPLNALAFALLSRFCYMSKAREPRR